nr:glycosyltransferase [Marinitoga sp. 1138]
MEVVAREIKRITKDIFEEQIVITFNKENKYIVENIEGVEVHRLPIWFDKFSVRFSPKYNRILNKIIKNGDVLLYHYASGQPELFFTFNKRIKKNKNIKKIVFYHMDVDGRGIISDLYNNYVDKTFFPYVDKLITTSPNIVKTSKILKKYNKNIKVIPLFVDTKHFYYRENNKRSYLIKKFNISNQEEIKIILYVGRFGRYKGLNYLIKAISKLPKNYKLVLIGKGPKEKELRKLVNELKLINRVLFLNPVKYEELPLYYSAADVFVLPSIDRGEAFGLVALEAMACGIPGITTELGTGTTYHNINKVTGLHVPPMNEKALANAILEIINNNMKEKNKEKIRKRAEEFSIIVFKRRIYKELAFY